MIRPAVFLATALVFVTSAQTARTEDKPKESQLALEKKLHGVWESGLDCVGDIVLRPDGTFDRLHYSPGNNTPSGMWEVWWNALPPTLVLTCKTSDDADLAGKTWEFKVVRLDDEALDLTDSMLPGGQPIRYTRAEKTATQEPETEDPAQAFRGMIYGPLREDGTREVTIRKDAVGKRVMVEGIALGQPFSRKGQEGTISPWAGAQVVHQGGSVFVKGIDFTESKARGKPVRVSGILRLDPGTHSRFGDLKPYYFIEATTFEPLDAVTDPYLVLVKE